MAKKNFTVTDITASMAGALNTTPTITTIPEKPTENIPTQEEQAEKPRTGKNKGLKVGEERVSFILLEGQLEKIQAIAYWERQSIKDTVIEIFEKAIRDYGEIKPRPAKKRQIS